MLCRFCRLLMLIFALPFTPAGAADFSTQACQEIAQKYGVTPQSCPLDNSAKRWVRSQDLGSEVQENHVFFSSGGTVLDAGARAQIALLARILAAAPMHQACLRLIGHSDTSGGAQANHRLALKRAEAVRAELAKYLSNAARIESVEALGETQPLDGLKGSSPWQRRVEIQARSCL